MSTEIRSVFGIFQQSQETFEDAKKKSSEESRKKTAYLRFTKDGTYAIRILPLAPIQLADGTLNLPRKGYEYPTKELVLKINVGVDDKGKDKFVFVNVTNARYTFTELKDDLIDLYVKMACDRYSKDTKLCEKIKNTSFNGGLKYDSKRCMYVYDMEDRASGLQVVQISFAQYKEIEERKLDLWSKRFKKDSTTPCPLSSIDKAYPLEVKRTTDKKTEYKFTIDTESEYDVLTEEELTALFEAPRLPEVLYKYSRYHLEATIEYLKQYDEKMGIDIMDMPEIKECVEQISMLLPADDHSHFNPSSNGESSDNGKDTLDTLWNRFDEIEKAGLDDKSEEALELRGAIKEFIEDNELDVVMTRKTSNYDLLLAIEEEMKDDERPSGKTREEEEEEEEEAPRRPAPVDDDEDEEPADPSPRRRRNEDTNEPAERPSRRGARPSRRG